MNILNLLRTSFLTAFVAVVSVSHGQVASPAAEVRANSEVLNVAITEGVLKVNGVLYVVTAGIAKRIDLADGQMATMDGLVKPIPPTAVLPGGVPQATISGGAVTAPARTGQGATSTGSTGTPQSERNRNVGDPTPGATNSTSGR